MDLPPLPLAVVRAVASGGRSLAVREMTPVQEIEAAIARLEQLRSESTGPNRWMVDPDSPEKVLHPDKPGNGWDGTYVADTGLDELGLPTRPADSRLIVTLHRTIDAQLAILHEAEKTYRVWRETHVGREAARSLALARAINGGAS